MKELSPISEMSLQRPAYVYILTNHSKTSLYIGVTAQLRQRITDQKNGVGSSFAALYNLNDLVYVEDFDSIQLAISREKALKKWRRAWKNALIDRFNPDWIDLSWDVIYSGI